jgi:hypothetical protein
MYKPPNQLNKNINKMKPVISENELKKQIGYHTKLFKQSDTILTNQYRNDKRDILIQLNYVHQIDQKEGDISYVELILQNEEFKDRTLYSPKQTALIKAKIDNWIVNEEKYGKFLN